MHLSNIMYGTFEIYSIQNGKTVVIFIKRTGASNKVHCAIKSVAMFFG